MTILISTVRPGRVFWLALVSFGTAMSTSVLAAEPTLEELLQRLEERDALIRRLEERVERLEQRQPGRPPETATPTTTQPVPDRPSPATVEDRSQDQPEVTATTEEPPRQGQLDVDPEAAERALERTLVLTGNLLLPVGRVDLEPSIGYTHADDRQGLDVVFVGNDAITDRVRVRTDTVTGTLGARVGLPFDSQLEASIPFLWKNEETSRTLLGVSEDRSASGFGDFRLGLAKTLVRESGWVPDLIGRVTWDSNTGEDAEDGVTLDSGFNEVGFSLSALKRQDPLAFTTRLSYEHAFESDSIKPGETFGLGAAVLLAASPETSLSLGFDAAWQGDVEVAGRTVPGSDQNTAALSFGVSSVLGRNVFLNARASAGLTEDTSDYAVVVSVPIRFNLFAD